MKRILPTVAVSALTLGTHAAMADKLTSTDAGRAVTQLMDEFPSNGEVTVVWAADANLAGTLLKSDPNHLLDGVSGINPEGSMSLNTAAAFIAALNTHMYLGITNWRLPTTYSLDLSCSFTAQKTGNTFGYDCAIPFYMPDPRLPLTILNPSYVFSEMAALFNALGGEEHDAIQAHHNNKLSLFKHVQPYLYWSQTAQTNNFQFGNDFWFQNGFEGTENQYDSMYVWPVATVTSTVQPAQPPMLQACAVGVNSGNTQQCTGIVVESGLGLPSETLPPPHNTLQTSSDGKLIYDPTTVVTYLADANLPKTLLKLIAHANPGTMPADSQYLVANINPDGSMNQGVLQNFLNALNAAPKSGVSTPYLNINTWNTPTTAASDPDCSLVDKGQMIDFGYNCDGTASQLGELFYNQLGGVAGDRVKNPMTASGRLFKNLKADYYWQCLPNGVPPASCGHPVPNSFIPSFSFRSGYEGLQSNVNELFVILVTPGNAIPAYEASLVHKR